MLNCSKGIPSAFSVIGVTLNCVVDVSLLLFCFEAIGNSPPIPLVPPRPLLLTPVPDVPLLLPPLPPLPAVLPDVATVIGLGVPDELELERPEDGVAPAAAAVVVAAVAAVVAVVAAAAVVVAETVLWVTSCPVLRAFVPSVIEGHLTRSPCVYAAVGDLLHVSKDFWLVPSSCSLGRRSRWWLGLPID